jgi:hypothetical protein
LRQPPVPDGVFELYVVAPRPDGTLDRRLSGRFELRDGAVRVLLDLHGHLQELAGALTPANERHLRSLRASAYYALEGPLGKPQAKEFGGGTVIPFPT